MRISMCTMAVALVLGTSSLAFAQFDDEDTEETTVETTSVTEVKAKPVNVETKTTTTTTTTTEDNAKMAINQGWNSTWALHFVLNNIFTSGAVLSPALNLGIGGSYNLSDDLAARLAVTFGRSSNRPTTVKTTNETAGSAVTTYSTGDPGNTSTGNVNVRADVLYRLLMWQVAPYLGGGVFFNYTHSQRHYTDDSTVVDQVRTFNDSFTSTSFGLRGILGAEWRFHSNFALYAEYQLLFTLLSHVADRDQTTTENTVNGERTVNRVTTESKVTNWASFSTGLGQGAQLGLAVHF